MARAEVDRDGWVPGKPIDDGSGVPVDCMISSRMRIEADDTALDVTIELTCTETGSSGDRIFGQRSWHRRFDRDLA